MKSAKVLLPSSAEQSDVGLRHAVNVRRAALKGALILLYVGLLLRLAWIQCYQHERWKALAAESHTKRVTIPARRGFILDRRGRKLARGRGEG